MCYTLKQYENRLRKLVEIDRQIKALEKERETVANDIKSDMGDNETVAGNDFIIRYQKVFKNVFDTKSFKASHMELYNAFTKSQITRPFTYDET